MSLTVTLAFEVEAKNALRIEVPTFSLCKYFWLCYISAQKADGYFIVSCDKKLLSIVFYFVSPLCQYCTTNISTINKISKT